MSFSESGARGEAGVESETNDNVSRFRKAFAAFKDGTHALGLAQLRRLSRGEDIVDSLESDQQSLAELKTTYRDWKPEDFSEFIRLYDLYVSLVAPNRAKSLAEVSFARNIPVPQLIDQLVELKPYL